MSRRGLVASLLLGVVALVFVTSCIVAWRSLADLPAREEIARAAARVGPAAGEADEMSGTRSGGPSLVTEPQHRVRFVEEDGIAVMRPVGPLLRAPSAAPEPEPEPEPPEGPEPDVYNLVVIRSAGVIDGRSRLLGLAHVDTPSADRICRREDGETWPCGRRARTALRRLVRRRDIACHDLDPDAPPPEKGTPVPARCSVGTTDLSRWLVANGWAEPAEGAPEEWSALHETAKSEGRGLYAAAPR